MSKSEKVLEFYKALLATFDIIADDNGLLSHKTSGAPIMIDGKRLAIPTNANIKLAGRNELVMFHPLSENVFEGMSEVFIELRHIVTAKLHKIIAYTAHTLLKLVLDKASHEGLSNKQMATISSLSDVDEKFVDSFKKLINKLEVTGNKQLLNLFMKYGGELNGEKYMRVAYVSFPLLELIDSSEDYIIHDVKFRKKDMAILKTVFTVIVPKAFEENAYSAGSNSSISPYFVSLLLAACNVLEDTGSTTWRFRSYIEDEVGESQHVTASDILDKLSGEDSILDFVNAIPPMPYNTGDNKTGKVIDDDDDEERPKSRASRATTTRDTSRAAREDVREERVEEAEEEYLDELRDTVSDVMGIPANSLGRGGLRDRDDRDDRRRSETSYRDNGRRTSGLRDRDDVRGRGALRRRDSHSVGLRDRATNYRVSSRDDMDDLRRGNRGRSTNPAKTLPRMP